MVKNLVLNKNSEILKKLFKKLQLPTLKLQKRTTTKLLYALFCVQKGGNLLYNLFKCYYTN